MIERISKLLELGIPTGLAGYLAFLCMWCLIFLVVKKYGKIL